MAIVEIWAPPGFWGPYADLRSHTGGSRSYTVSFDTVSGSSTFDAEIEYVDAGGLERVVRPGPGSYTIHSSGGAGTDRIRCRSHSLGQTIRVTY
nr:colicin Z C-terminal domain-related protein [Halomonas sp.]